SAVRLGAKVIWMPTYTSANDIAVKAFSRRVAGAYKNKPPHPGAAEGLTVLGKDGKVLPEADAILEIAREHDIAVATGHLSAAEGAALARRGKEGGFTQ